MSDVPTDTTDSVPTHINVSDPDLTPVSDLSATSVKFCVHPNPLYRRGNSITELSLQYPLRRRREKDTKGPLLTNQWSHRVVRSQETPRPVTPGTIKDDVPTMAVGDEKKKQGSVEDHTVHTIRVVTRKDKSIIEKKMK